MNKKFSQVSDFLKERARECVVVLAGISFTLFAQDEAVATSTYNMASDLEFVGLSVAPSDSDQLVIASDEEIEISLSENILDKGDKSDEVSSPNLSNDVKELELMSKWNDNLDRLTAFEDNWDGDDARGIRPETICNCKEVLQKTSNQISYLTSIIPTPFGSVCLEWRKNGDIVNAEISISGIAFYRDSENDPFFFEYSEDFETGICALVHELNA